MHSNPYFSVIITTYNRVRYLIETLESVLNQTFTDFEVLVIDDGSTDNTQEVVSSFADSRITYIKTSNSGGPARPRNVGINKSTGKFLAFCDDDDLWEPFKLELISRTIVDKGIGFIFSSISYIDGNGKPKGKPLKIHSDNIIPRKSEMLVLNNFITLSSVVVSRALLGESTFNEDPDFVAAEDVLLWYELNSQSELYFCATPLVLYRVHEQNISRNKHSRYKLNLKVQALVSDKHGYSARLLSLAGMISELKMMRREQSNIRMIYLVIKLLIVSAIAGKTSLVIRTLFTLIK